MQEIWASVPRRECPFQFVVCLLLEIFFVLMSVYCMTIETCVAESVGVHVNCVLPLSVIVVRRVVRYCWPLHLSVTVARFHLKCSMSTH